MGGTSLRAFVHSCFRSDSAPEVSITFPIRIGDTHVIAKRTPVNQQVERSLVPMARTPAGLDPLKPQVLHPGLALPNLIRCQTSLNSWIYGAHFGNYVRVTDW